MKNLEIVGAALSLCFATLSTLNAKFGKGFVETVTVNVNDSNLEAGLIKGSVARTSGDKRVFSLKANSTGTVKVRFLDHTATING